MCESLNWICVCPLLLFPFTTIPQSPISQLHTTVHIHTQHRRTVNAINDNTLALLLFQPTTSQHHFTRPSLQSHSPPHLLSVGSNTLCATTVHRVTNHDTQTLMVLQHTTPSLFSQHTRFPPLRFTFCNTHTFASVHYIRNNIHSTWCSYEENIQ